MENNRTLTGAGSYSDVKQQHDFHNDSGVVVMPVAGRTSKFKLIRLHGGIGIRTVTWKSSRAGKPPIIPAMDDIRYGPAENQIADRFISGSVTTSLPRINPGAAGYDWNVSGEYRYVQNFNRVAGSNTIPCGAFPFPVAPQDPISSALVANTPVPQGVVGAGTPNPIDTAMSAIGAAVVDHVKDGFVWPFTYLTPQFTSNDLFGA